MERGYQCVPTLSLIFLIEKYEELIKEGVLNYRGELLVKKILKDITEELSFRITPEERHQITIDEYMRERSKGDGKI